MYFLIFLVEMTALFVLSRKLNQSIFDLFYRLSHSQRSAILGTTLILFPGTVIHELSHLFVAEIMGVRTGKLSLIPERIDREHIQAGSVEVSRTDPIRRSIIGVAPILVGTIAVTLLSTYLAHLLPQALAAAQHPDSLKNPTIYFFTLIGYLLFSISNNMFSSREDLRGVPAVLIVIAIFIGSLYVSGLRFQIPGQIITYLSTLTLILITNIATVLAINLFLLILLTIVLLSIRKR